MDFQNEVREVFFLKKRQFILFISNNCITFATESITINIKYGNNYH